MHSLCSAWGKVSNYFDRESVEVEEEVQNPIIDDANACCARKYVYARSSLLVRGAAVTCACRVQPQSSERRAHHVVLVEMPTPPSRRLTVAIGD